MAEFIARWFTPSKSDQGAPIQQPSAAPVQPRTPAVTDETIAKRAKKKSVSKFGGAPRAESLLAGDEAGVAKKMLLGQ